MACRILGVMAETDLLRVRDVLTTQVFRNLEILPRAGSTNDVAKALAGEGAPEGTVVVADEQTAGRGRLERRWLAPPGTCLLCSLLFRPELLPARAQWLTMLCAMAAADAVDQVAALQVALKWPNDLIVEAPGGWRKLAGILTETGIAGERLTYVVVGVGINVNVPHDVLPTLAPDATSLLAEMGREIDRAALLAAFLAGVERRYQALGEGTSPHPEWAGRLATLGQPVRAITSGETITGVAESVDEDGALLLRTPDGTRHRFLAGDVTLDRA